MQTPQFILGLDDELIVDEFACGGGMSDARDIEHTITEETRKALEGFEARLLALLPPKETT